MSWYHWIGPGIWAAAMSHVLWMYLTGRGDPFDAP